MKAPNGPGWWAFEGGEWHWRRVPCAEDDANKRGEDWFTLDEELDEEEYVPWKYVESVEGMFQWVVKVEWVKVGMSFNQRRQSGPHHGKPQLGFLSPKYRWNHGHYAVDTVVGEWTRVVVPWEKDND